MNDVIRLLPDSVANQIAAGEVIQRPASVIKELVENAVDAGATEIRIFIKDAGRTLIQVIDNGCGMSATDARMAFERHATSKISRADDLFNLSTMGFRGEALPSICAISRVEVRSMRPSDHIGTHLVINASRVESQTADVCEPGTSISVSNLFFNVPARRKFLKSDNVELSNVMREFERLALVNCGLSMSIDTGSRRIDLREGSFLQRIHDLWKNNLNMQLLPVEVDTSLIKIHGYVSRPEFARRRNALQYLFVNGRHMRHPYFHKAILSCYEGLIASDTQPCYFLKFEVDPSSIDVNIHPTKNEIKFEYESEIWPLLVAAVKGTLGKNSAVPSIDFDAKAIPEAQIQITAPAPDSRPIRPVSAMPEGYSPYSRRPDTRNWDTLYADFMTRGGKQLPEAPTFERQEPTLPGMEEKAGATQSSFIQYAQKYIVTPTRDGLMIIDQHRAHVKVLFEQYLANTSAVGGVSQGVMFPETITLDASRRAALAEVESDLARMGFVLEYDSDDRWRIVGVPAMLKDTEPADIVMRILESVCEDSLQFGADTRPVDSMLERIALVMARGAAIKRGRRLSVEEMEQLVAQLFLIPDPAYTPSGAPVYTLLDDQSLARLLS